MLKLLFRIAVLLTLLAAMIAGAFTPFYARVTSDTSTHIYEGLYGGALIMIVYWAIAAVIVVRLLVEGIALFRGNAQD
jgi:uncharacterized membrane protein